MRQFETICQAENDAIIDSLPISLAQIARDFDFYRFSGESIAHSLRRQAAADRMRPHVFVGMQPVIKAGTVGFNLAIPVPLAFHSFGA